MRGWGAICRRRARGFARDAAELCSPTPRSTHLQEERDASMSCLSRVPGWWFIQRRAIALMSVALAVPVAAAVAAAQTGSIVGTITDGDSKTAIPSVQVQ